ncbi:MAG: hypothetical protein PHQ77_03035 [Proteiniphilum sp.]|nr:hypothetical protein [Proteiniphilum sp.]
MMTKKTFMTLVLVVTSGALMSLQAQNLFSKGDKIANVGIGLGSYYGGDGYTSSIPPLSVSYEQGIIDGLLDGKASIGVGGYMAYTANKWETISGNVTYGYKYSYFILGARGTFHYQFIDKLDTYTGLMLGYNAVRSKFFGDSGSYTPEASGASGIGYSAFIGARYHFSDKLAAFAEIGYGISALELGISFRL